MLNKHVAALDAEPDISGTMAVDALARTPIVANIVFPRLLQFLYQQ